MLKEKDEWVSSDEIFDMLEDFMLHLENGDPDDYETTQQCMGMKELFRGFIIKDWKGANYHCDKCKILNKMLIKHSVQFYRKCWMHRNEYYDNPEKQRSRINEWRNKLKSFIERKEPLIVKLFIRRNQIHVNNSNTKTIKRLICNSKEIMKKGKSYQEMTFKGIVNVNLCI